ncbi:MAG: class II aldolase/adducin family protein [Planctomycetota bacterium]
MSDGSWRRVDEQALRVEMAAIARRTYEAGFVVATNGNLSGRLGESTLLISPSGSCKGELSPEDFVRIDTTGHLRDGRPGDPPSSETLMHLAIYEERSDVHAILHAHPPITVGFSVAGESLAGCVIPEVVVGLGTIPTIEYTTPTTRETAEAVRGMIRRRDALILERHGTVTVGSSITDAFRKLEKVEHAAHVTLVAKQVGKVRALPPEEVERLLEIRQRLGLPPVIPSCNDCGLGCM